MSLFILFFTLGLSCWLIRRDTAQRTGISGALWIPTLWVAVISSRPLSLWVGSDAIDTLDGSPLDRAFFFLMLLASLVVLSKRGVSWRTVISHNWPILLFYGYLLVSVTWTNSPVSSLKRWTKEAGNIGIVLVILTEVNPLDAIRAVFARCAYLLIPLSVVLLRYFPSVGRFYNVHSGELQITGVTTQKNSLGIMILVCLVIVFWDWVENSRLRQRRAFLDRLATLTLFAAGGWLLWVSDSKTSMTCLALGIALVSAVRLPFLHRRVNVIGGYCLVAAIAFVVAEWAFGISRSVISDLGRDMTFTGRTDVWRELLNVHTDPLFGTGYMSFWDDMHYREMLPPWVAYSAHNGYLEIYLTGGWIGVGFLILMLLGVGLRINRALATGSYYALVRFAIYAIVLLANFSESNFAWMSPLGVLFLVAAIGEAERSGPLILSPASAIAPRAAFVPAGTRDAMLG